MCYNKAAATVWAAPLHDTERGKLPMPLYSTTCSVPDCNKPARLRGWCKRHYDNWWRTGDPIPYRWTLAHTWWKHVEFAEDGCWNWQGALTSPTQSRGYGQLTDPLSQRLVVAHRYVYEFCVGPIPEGLEIDHLCRNPRCVNPDHLEPVTHSENCLRSPVGMAATRRARALCPQGHPYTGDNLYVYPDGTRCCRTCRRAHQAAWRRKQVPSWG